MTCASSICNSLEFSVAADRRVSAVEEEDRSGLSSSSTSSIGKNSDESSVGGGEGEEVESEYKEGALDSLDALEEVLPVDQLLMMNPLPTVGQAFAMISQEESHRGIFSVPSQQLETSTVFYDEHLVKFRQEGPCLLHNNMQQF